MRVLVAEDETVIRLDLQGLLQGAGFDVVGAARDGEEAVELARSECPDLAILDVKMPRLDGIDAARKILHERPIPRAVFVEEEKPEAPDEERRFWTGNVGVSSKLAPSEPRTQRQEPERRQRCEGPGFGEGGRARESEPGGNQHNGDHEAIDAFVQFQKDGRTLHCWISDDGSRRISGASSADTT